MLTAALRGFHQAPRDLPTAQNHSHAHCPLCCYVFTVCLKNSPLSNSAASILKVSHHSPRQAKPVPRTRTANTFHFADPALQMLSENKIVDVTDMRSLTKLIPGSFLASQTTATLLRCCSGEGPRATRFCSLYYICCQANCLPCTLRFWTGV